MAWFYAALASAIIWGFSYALGEKILKGSAITPAFLMTITGIIYAAGSIALAMALGQFKTGWNAVLADHKLFFNILIVAVSYVIGAWLIYLSISLKDATLANLIEVSYPIFTAIFAYILYRESQLNYWTGMGGVLILAGIALIYMKS